jgi:UDP-N-acetylglucosamine 2-epimerase (non-hydrolysing)
MDKARQRDTLKRLGLEGRPFVYVTLHRPSNVDQEENLGVIMKELARLSQDFPIVFPMHPRTRKMLGQFGISVESAKGLKILEPLGYHDSLCLTESARFVLTDSGGLQEESTFFRTPCLTLRPNTERPITLTLGSNRLTSPPRLRTDIEAVLSAGERSGSVPPFWDGRTAERTLLEITSASGVSANAGATPALAGI